MKKLIFIPVLVSFLFTQIYTQTIDLNWAPDFKTEKLFFSKYQPLHVSDDAYFVLSANKKEASILQFDLEHKFISHTDFVDELNGLNIVPENVLRTKNNVFAYTTIYNKKTKLLNLYASELVQGDFQAIEEKYQQDYEMRSFLKTAGLALVFSEPIPAINVFANLAELELSSDSTVVALINESPFQKLKEKKEIDIAVFDEDLNVLWERKVELGIPANSFYGLQKAIANDGSVYILVDELRRLSERNKYTAPYKTRFFKITKDNVQEISLDISNESSIADARIVISRQTGDVSIAGFYADGLIGDGLQGVFYVTGNTEKGFGPFVFEKFDNELLGLFNSERAISKGRGLPYTFTIREEVLHMNGDMTLAAEINFVEDVGDEECPDEEFHSYDILMPRFSPDGSLVNMTYIQKSFVSDADGTPNSFALTSDEENIYLLFNYQKTKQDFGSDEQKCYSCAFTDLAIIDQQGDLVSRTEVAMTKAKDGFLLPKLSKANESTFLISAKDLKVNSVGLLRVE